jgi:hypothetical protein
MLYSSNYDVKMSLDASTRNILEKNTQSSENGAWDSAWVHILTTLFPFSSQPYAVCPQKRNGTHGDLIMEVAKVTRSTPTTKRRLRIVLVVEIKDPLQWDSGKESLLQQLDRKTDLAFKSTAKEKVYWIATIGPNWQYGEKKDGQCLKPLSEWHHVTFDDASCLDLENVAKLVRSLDE